MALVSDKRPVIGRSGLRAQAMAEKLSARLNMNAAVEHSKIPITLRRALGERDFGMLNKWLSALIGRSFIVPEAMPSFRSLVLVWLARMVQAPAADGNTLGHLKPGREPENRSSPPDSSERKWPKGPDGAERLSGSGTQATGVEIRQPLPLANSVKFILFPPARQGEDGGDQVSQYRFKSPPLSLLRRLLRQPSPREDRLMESIMDFPVSKLLLLENAMGAKSSYPHLGFFHTPVPPARFFQTIAEGNRAVLAGGGSQSSLAMVLLGRMARLPEAASDLIGLSRSIHLKVATRESKQYPESLVRMIDGLSGHWLHTDNAIRNSNDDESRSAWDKSHFPLSMKVRFLQESERGVENLTGEEDPAGKPISSQKLVLSTDEGDVKIRSGTFLQTSTDITGTLPSMALDSGIHAGMTVLSAKMRITDSNPPDLLAARLTSPRPARPGIGHPMPRIIRPLGQTPVLAYASTTPAMPASPAGDIYTVAPIAANRLRGPLQGLGTAAREARIHRDGQADRMARRLQADAVTIGADIFFRYGRFEPESPEGFALLSHELTHVRQHLQGEIPDHTKGYAFPETLERQAGRIEQTAFLERSTHPVEASPRQENAFFATPPLDMHLPLAAPPSQGQAGQSMALPQGAALPTPPLRAAEDRDMPASSQASAPDTAALAAQVFRLLERRLQIDKERLGIRRR